MDGINYDTKIVECVKKRDILYNRNARFYRNNLLKERTWRQVAGELRLPVSEVKSRWRALRERFARETKKEKQPPNGSEGSYISSWHLMDDLRFLDCHIAHVHNNRRLRSDCSPTSNVVQEVSPSADPQSEGSELMNLLLGIAKPAGEHGDDHIFAQSPASSPVEPQVTGESPAVIKSEMEADESCLELLSDTNCPSPGADLQMTAPSSPAASSNCNSQSQANDIDQTIVSDDPYSLTLRLESAFPPSNNPGTAEPLRVETYENRIPQPEKRKRNQEDNTLEMLMIERLKRRKQDKPRTEIHHFCNMIAEILSKMDKKRAQISMFKIHELLLKETSGD